MLMFTDTADKYLACKEYVYAYKYIRYTCIEYTHYAHNQACNKDIRFRVYITSASIFSPESSMYGKQLYF